MRFIKINTLTEIPVTVPRDETVKAPIVGKNVRTHKLEADENLQNWKKQVEVWLVFGYLPSGSCLSDWNLQSDTRFLIV